MKEHYQRVLITSFCHFAIQRGTRTMQMFLIFSKMCWILWKFWKLTLCWNSIFVFHCNSDHQSLVLKFHGTNGRLQRFLSDTQIENVSKFHLRVETVVQLVSTGWGSVWSIVFDSQFEARMYKSLWYFFEC